MDETKCDIRITILHEQSQIASAECYADNGNSGYYMSTLSVSVADINGHELDDFVLLDV